MEVTCKINDYSTPEKVSIQVHSVWDNCDFVELEVNGERYTVNAQELISAVQRAKLDVFGR